MFLSLLAVTFGIALTVSFIVARVFDQPVKNILARIIADEIHQAWVKYIQFAIYVVGVSGGVRVWELERYITPHYAELAYPPGYAGQAGRLGEVGPGALALNADRWVLEVYRTIIETMQSVAWMLMVFFVFALIAYVIVRVFELRQPKAVQ